LWYACLLLFKTIKLMRKYIFLFILLIGFFYPSSANDYFKFFTLPDLPPSAGCQSQPGLDGLYSGLDDDALIVAGGANFPGKKPWEGGEKIYYDDIFILQKKAGGEYSWEKMQQKLPFAMAYGGAVATPRGLLCFGGNTNDKCVAESWLVDYIPEANIVLISPGPKLPLPLANFAFAKIGNTIYVAGGISELGGKSENVFYSLKMAGDKPEDWKWEILPAWEGTPRAFAAGAVQSNGVTDCFYLFSGMNILPGNQIQPLFDAHVFNPSTKKWTIISNGENEKFPVMSGTAFAVGASSIVFASGISGKMITIQQTLMKNREPRLSVVDGNNAEGKAGAFPADSDNYLSSNPGFGNQLLCYNTVTNEIYEIGKLPGTGQVATTATRWGDDLIIPSGAIQPGVNTPSVLKISIVKDGKHLGFLDIVVIALYFIILAWMGVYFSKRQKNTNDYFKGGGRIPWWAAGLSIFGTALSAITFMAIPAKTYATDWSYFMMNMTIFLVAPIIIFLFIPFYRRLNITTAYEYLEGRFNLAVRLIGSLSFILFQIGRMGVVLFLPSIALNVVTGIDIFVCIALMGVVSLVYTMMGGIEAVIWTDVMQVVVLLGGAILSLAVIIFSVKGGFTSIFEVAAQNHKFNVIDFDWSLRQPTVWVMLLGGMFANITTYGTDQTMVQRYMTTKTQKEANQSVWTNAILVVPSTVIFFFIGTALFVFYKNFPGSLNPAFESNDAIFPWYIVSKLPAGVSGLLIAAIFAAAMSSLSSSMNSAATAYSTDIHFRFGWNKNSNQLKIAKRATLLLGTAGIIFAILMATWDIQSLWDEFQKVLGLIIGSLGGVFLLGILSKKANSGGALVGIGISIIVQILVGYYEPVHLLVYSATGVLSCFISGWLASFFFKHPKAGES